MSKSIKLGSTYIDINALNGLGKYASLYQPSTSEVHGCSSWTRTKLEIGNWAYFSNAGDLFSVDEENDAIVSNFKGTVLIMRSINLNVDSQFDIYDTHGRSLQVNSYSHFAFDVYDCVVGTKFYVEYQTGASSFSTYYGSKLMLIRLA